MNRSAVVMFALVLALAACGNNKQTICGSEQPPPAACQQMCMPGGANTCPLGFYCDSGGKCNADCTPGATQCPANNFCTSDGHCQPNGGGPDANCPAVHFTPMPTTPAVELLLDRSGSMAMNDIAPTRYDALHTALTGPMGAVTATQGSVIFGAALFSGDETPCPPNANLDGMSVPRALNNANAIDGLIAANGPGGSTPTAVWITAVKNDFAAHPPPMGTAPIILLATDGDPNACGNGSDNGASVAATKAAFTAGIRTFIIGLAGLNTQFLQDVANAGTGKPTGQNPGCANCAPFYTASDPASLAAGFSMIISGVLSCDLTLTGHVDPAQQCQGTVTLNGQQLMCGTDWSVDPNGMIIHLMGAACDMLKNSTNPTVDASFPCGAVIQ
jgi:hypothetical protein